MRLRNVLLIFVAAPIAAAVLITLLLLLGVRPHLVFLPGHIVKDAFHAPNAVGVLTTEVFWWGVIVIAGWLVGRRSTRAPDRVPPPSPPTSA